MTTDAHAGAPQLILADKPRIKQILVNLGNNALKFTEKGTVQFHYEMLTDTKLKVSVKDSGDKSKLMLLTSLTCFFFFGLRNWYC